MKILLVTAVLISSATFQVSAQLDKSVSREIKVWKKGTPPPARLLKFPDGKIDAIPLCGMRVWGSSVDDYISEIKDPDLLAALIFDHRAQPETFQAAARRLMKVKGLDYLFRLLEDKRKTESSPFMRSELAVLTQLLRSPYVAIKVARIAKEDMEQQKAESVLIRMKSELEAGKSWSAAYGKFADENPDLRDRVKNPATILTLLCYVYDGIVSPGGFDILSYYIPENLPAGHLQELFRIKRGTHVLKVAGGTYLYHIESFFAGAS